MAFDLESAVKDVLLTNNQALNALLDRAAAIYRGPGYSGNRRI
jgi:hypothetical protein